MRRYSQEERQKLIAAFRSSGMTQREFARTRGLNFYTLQHWLHYKPKRSKKPRLVTVDVETRDLGGVAWEVESSRGEVLRVRGVIAPGDLERVLAAMATPELSR